MLRAARLTSLAPLARYGRSASDTKRVCWRRRCRIRRRRDALDCSRDKLPNLTPIYFHDIKLVVDDTLECEQISIAVAC